MQFAWNSSLLLSALRLEIAVWVRSVRLEIDLNRGIFRGKPQPVGEAVHEGKVAGPLQYLECALLAELFAESGVVGIVNAGRLTRQLPPEQHRGVFAGGQRLVVLLHRHQLRGIDAKLA